MSTITDSKKKVTLPPPDDPFYYGWRDINRRLPDGTLVHEQIPLTLEDCLHPQEGDYIVESDLHDHILSYFATVLRARYADDPTVLVLSDTGVYWDDPELEHQSPDDCVIFGVRQPKEEWPSFNVAEEGTRPSLIIEVVSPNTRSNDIDTKVDHYHRAKVPYYVILDRKRLGGEWTLISYRNTPEGYVEAPPNERGWVWLEPVGLWLGLKDNQPRLYEGTTCEEIGDYETISRFLKEQQARAEAEKARAETEKARAEAEKARAETEKARAEAEKARADAETQARQQLEARLRILEEELRQRRGNGPS